MDLTACGTSPCKGEVYGHAGFVLQQLCPELRFLFLNKEMLGEVEGVEGTLSARAPGFLH